VAIRSFIAIDIEEDAIIQKIREIQESLAAVNADIKFVEPQNLHYTLKFLGDVDEGVIGDITAELKKIKFPKFKMKIEKIGAFPTIARIRVIWVGASTGAENMIELNREIEDYLEKFRFKRENRKFTPHLTIGRVRSGKHKDRLVSVIQNLKDIEIGEIKVTCFKLKKSTLTPKGPIYETLATFYLEG